MHIHNEPHHEIIIHSHPHYPDIYHRHKQVNATNSFFKYSNRNAICGNLSKDKTTREMNHETYHQKQRT